MKVTLHPFSRLLGGFSPAAQKAPALEVKRLPLAPTYPVQETTDPLAKRFLEAVINLEDIPIYYQGGSTPGVFRRFQPTSLYRLTPNGPILASGHCSLRGSTRALRIDRVRLA
ncbi:hypothetical protein [Haloferula sp.]|uniref:hypothetical protein n=1 Tax=Haloferula sp. TaxID=2497595 RepID=UPI00329DDAC8